MSSGQTISPETLKYAESHEWVSIDSNGIATIGISSFAVAELTDLVFMALPEPGTSIQAGGEFGEVESVKAVSSLNSPLSGKIIEVNKGLTETLEVLSSDPYTKGWMIRLEPSNLSELDTLLSYEDYLKQCGQ